MNEMQQIIAEMNKAARKFPTWPVRGIDAAAIVAEESGELQRAALQATYEGGTVEDVRKEAIQTAAMAIQFLLNLPDTTFDPVPQVPKRLPAEAAVGAPARGETMTMVWCGEVERAYGARVIELDPTGNIRLEDETGEFYVWQDPAPAGGARLPGEE